MTKITNDTKTNNETIKVREYHYDIVMTTNTGRHYTYYNYIVSSQCYEDLAFSLLVTSSASIEEQYGLWIGRKAESKGSKGWETAQDKHWGEFFDFITQKFMIADITKMYFDNKEPSNTMINLEGELYSPRVIDRVWIRRSHKDLDVDFTDKYCDCDLEKVHLKGRCDLCIDKSNEFRNTGLSSLATNSKDSMLWTQYLGND